MTRLALVWVALFLDSSHLPAPIALAWSHPEFRQRVVLPHKIKYIVLPLAAFVLAMLTVPATRIFWPGFEPIIGIKVRAVADWNAVNPFTVMLTLFVVWNIYHFGSQSFGLWRLWRKGRGRRWLQKSSWVGGTFAGMVGTPLVVPMLTSFSVWGFGLWHWLPAISLAAKAHGRQIRFWVSMAVFGGVISSSLWLGVGYGTLAVAMSVVAARVGLGFVHFLYDRWVWRMSDPLIYKCWRRVYIWR